MDYYLSVGNVVLTSNVTQINIAIDDTIEEVKKEMDTENHILNITIRSDTTNNELPENFILKAGTLLSSPASIEPGSYHLWRSVDVNGFKFVLSDDSIGRIFNQYVLDYKPRFKDCIYMDHDAIHVKINSDLRIEDYIELINRSGILYVLSKDDDAFLSTVYGVNLNRANKISVRNWGVVNPRNDHILIEEADYIASLILRLRKEYPEVQFYNQDQDKDDSHYTEFVRYKPQSGSYGQEFITSPDFSDPIYGDIIYTTCTMEFEYHCADIVTYNKRRFDFQINRFLSNITTNMFRFPQKETEMKYTIHWDRDPTSQGYEYISGTTLNSNGNGHYAFNSTAKIFVTIYRLAASYPIIKRVIIEDPAIGIYVLVK